MSIVPDMFIFHGTRHVHCPLYQTCSFSMVPGMSIVHGTRYVHCPWYQTCSLSMVPNMFIVHGTRHVHCPWYQTCSLSMVLDMFIIHGTLTVVFLVYGASYVVHGRKLSVEIFCLPPSGELRRGVTRSSISLSGADVTHPFISGTADITMRVSRSSSGYILETKHSV